MEDSRYSLFTDGGSDGGEAASAALLRSPTGTQALAVYLGPGTNNEAEICGVLLGLSAFLLGRENEAIGLDWFADSEYALKSATEYIHNWKRNGWRTSKKEPVKNQGLWRCWLELSAAVPVRPHHVRGHAGHRENELCDLACNVVRDHGRSVLEEQGDGAAIAAGGVRWTVLDGRVFLQAMRAEDPSPAECHLLMTALRRGSGEEQQLSSDGAEEAAAVKRVADELRRAGLIADKSEAFTAFLEAADKALASYRRSRAARES